MLVNGVQIVIADDLRLAEIGKININIPKDFKTKGLRLLVKDQIKWIELTAIICEQAQDNQQTYTGSRKSKEEEEKLEASAKFSTDLLGIQKKLINTLLKNDTKREKEARDLEQDIVDLRNDLGNVRISAN